MLGAQRENTMRCFAFYDADSMEYQDKMQFTDTAGNKRRASVVFNKVKSNVDAVSGFMAQNRREAKFIARLNSSAAINLYSRYMNALHGYHRDNTNADQLETEQDSDMLICGYGAIESDLSYIVGNATTNPYGEIVKLKLDPDQVGWDPFAKAGGLLDARWVYYYQDYDLKDALGLFESSKENDFSQAENDEEETGYSYNPYGGVYDKIKLDDSVEWENKQNERVRVYNHQWYEFETFYRAPNPLYEADTPEDALYMQMRLEAIAAGIKSNGPEGIETSDMFDFDPAGEELVFDEKTKNALVRDFGELIEPVAFKRKCFYTAVYSGRHVFATFKSISQQGFSVKFKTGIYNRTKKIWVGMVNSMMEPQKYHNKALTELLFTIASNSKGGVMVEEDAVEDIKTFEKQYAKTDAVIKVNSGALANGKIQPKASPALPTGLENIITLSDQAIAQNGVDPSFMGSLEKQDQSGILYKRRIRQVISKMARYFDSITLYQKEDARLCADLIRVWVENNNGQFVRITGEDGADEFMQVNEDSMAPEYDVSIQEAAQTPEDKAETAEQLGTIASSFLSTGDNATARGVFAEALQFMSIDGDVRNRLIELMKPQEDSVPIQQFQQLEQLVQQLQSEQAQLAAAKTQSEIDKNSASAEKTRAETVSEIEDSRNKALENDLIRTGSYTEAKVHI